MANGTQQVIQDPAEQISDNLLQLSMAIDQIRANTPDLSDQDAQNLGTIARQLDEISDQLNAAAINSILNSTQANVADIVRATNQVQDAVKEANTVQKVFSIAGAALSLAAAIMSGNAGTIVSSLGSLVQTFGGGNAGGNSAGQGTVGQVSNTVAQGDS